MQCRENMGHLFIDGYFKGIVIGLYERAQKDPVLKIF